MMYVFFPIEILIRFQCAKGLGENQTANLCLCNMGVIEGSKKFDSFVKNFDFGDGL